jgi:hypothetical protein
VTGDLRENGTKSAEWQIVKLCIKLKIIDKRKVFSELLGQKYKVRKKIEEEYGKNNRRGRNMIKNLREEATKAKLEALRKNDIKMKHLRKKFRNSEEEKLDSIPDTLKDLKLEKLSIFNNNKFEEKEIVEYEVEIIGEQLQLMKD